MYNSCMHSPFKETLHSQTTFLTQNVLHGRLLAASGKAHLQKGVLKREHNSLRPLSLTTRHPIEVQAKHPPPRARFASNPLCVHTYGMPNRAQQESEGVMFCMESFYRKSATQVLREHLAATRIPAEHWRRTCLLSVHSAGLQ